MGNGDDSYHDPPLSCYNYYNLPKYYKVPLNTYNDLLYCPTINSPSLFSQLLSSNILAVQNNASMCIAGTANFTVYYYRNSFSFPFLTSRFLRFSST
jgi:hypothetical protein